MNSPSQHHEPMVAMICPEKTGEKLGKLYHNQYMSAEGKWTTDFDHKATCRQDKVEILEYCKKVWNVKSFSEPESFEAWDQYCPSKKEKNWILFEKPMKYKFA